MTDKDATHSTDEEWSAEYARHCNAFPDDCFELRDGAIQPKPEIDAEIRRRMELGCRHLRPRWEEDDGE